MALKGCAQTLLANPTARTDPFGHLFAFEAVLFALGRIG
jgi:hypothetical protein